MIFISYWELNPDFDPAEMAAIGQELISKKLYPAEGVKQLAYYISTSDYWGIEVDDAESEEAMVRSTNMWRVAKPGFIKFVKTSPAIEVAKVIPIVLKLKKQLKG
jgi:hypothetical protein